MFDLIFPIIILLFLTLYVLINIIFDGEKGREYNIEKKCYEISTIDTQTNYKGNFCLSVGVIDNKEYFQFYEKRDDKWYRKSIPVEKISIIEKNEIPSIIYNEMICTIQYKNEDSHSYTSYVESMEIIVPPNTIIKRYKNV